MVIRKNVGKIEFRILSPEFIRKMAAIEVVISELYDQDGFPVTGGLIDPRMGVVDPGLRCRTCGSRVGDCPGHFGFVELARPVIHVRHAETIYKILNAVCSECGRILLDPVNLVNLKKNFKKTLKEQDEFQKWKLVQLVYSATASRKSCPYCREPKASWKIEKPTNFVKNKERLTPIDVRDVLEKIPNEDLMFLGMNPEVTRPEWMIITALPVPPVTVRPSITLESAERSEDDLTHKLVDIMRINMRLKENMNAGAPAVIIEDLWELLQYHVTTFIDNGITGIPPAKHRSGRVLKGIAQRIKSKEGRFRHNLVGKRVNFSARTVISPDSNISIDEVGVPFEIARELTVPEVVTEKNAKTLKALIMQGSESRNGANYVLLPDGRKKKITEDVKEQLAEELKPGMIVERHLRDGDVVLFNRQPSLHRLSLLAHKVRILPYRTFRINPAICAPYNADFDGDEMNLHAPQTYEARVEAEELMAVRRNIRSPRFGGPIMGARQDHITALFLLTQKDVVLTKEEAVQLLFEADVTPMPEIKEDTITGKELFSLIVPKVSLKFASKACKSFGCVGECRKESCEHDAYVVIENGKLVKGVIDTNAVGAFSGMLLDLVCQKLGLDEGQRFINNFTRLGLVYFRTKGFSVNLDDFSLPKEKHQIIEDMLQAGERESEDKIDEFKRGELESWPGMTPEHTLEIEIVNILNRTRDKAVEVVRESMEKNNPAIIMANCGARGKVLNVAQMCACLGQQAVGGGRIKRGYEDRTLPHYLKGDIGARSHGFVHNSYGSGLDPFEFFWVAMAGREGLTDTSMRTPKSGYMYRRLANALQDLYVDYDKSVRDNRGRIIQFQYGEDGIDPSKSDGGSFRTTRVRIGKLS